jgi:hypothetical protein
MLAPVSGPPVSGTSYERLLLVGRGGMGEVFLARQRGAGGFERPVALKRILPGHGSDPDLRRLFVGEARMMASLNHPNICQTVDFCSVDSDLFLVLEFLDGVTLGGLMSATGMMSTAVVGGILLQALAGLDHAHVKGLIHRDLSPSNLFLTSDGVVKILDFGVAKVKGSAASSSGLKGKSPYMSPEQVAGKPLDERSDLFALGVVGLEALSGTTLFLRDSEYLTYQAILEGTRPTALTTSPLDPILARCLDVDPSARPQSARELAQELRTALVARGGEASAHDLAGYLQRHVGDELGEFRARVASALAAAPTGNPVILHTVEMAILADPALAQTVASPGRVARAGPEPPTVERSTRRSPGTGLLVAALLLALGLLAVFWVRGRADGDAGDPVRGPLAAGADAGSAIASLPRAPAIPVDAGPTAPAEPAEARSELADAGAEDTRPATRARRLGQVSIDASPFATLSIDGKPVGTTPLLRHPLPEGLHRVVATTADGRTRRLRIRVRAGKLTARRITFD